MPKIHVHASKDVRFEFEARKAGVEPKEIEVYVGGWYLCSVSIENLSDEVKAYIFNEDEES